MKNFEKAEKTKRKKFATNGVRIELVTSALDTTSSELFPIFSVDFSFKKNKIKY